MMEFFEEAQPLLDALWKIGTIVGILWVGLRQRSMANAAAIENLGTSLQQVHRRLAKIEGVEQRISEISETIQSQDLRLVKLESWREMTPGRQEMEKLHERISEAKDLSSGLQADLERLSGQMDIVLKKLNNLDRHYLGGSVK
ncbi:MAG: hypothetical protein ACPGOY_07000 [Rhodospirillaceae bacterium]